MALYHIDQGSRRGAQGPVSSLGSFPVASGVRCTPIGEDYIWRGRGKVTARPQWRSSPLRSRVSPAVPLRKLETNVPRDGEANRHYQGGACKPRSTPHKSVLTHDDQHSVGCDAEIQYRPPVGNRDAVCYFVIESSPPLTFAKSFKRVIQKSSLCADLIQRAARESVSLSRARSDHDYHQHRTIRLKLQHKELSFRLLPNLATSSSPVNSLTSLTSAFSSEAWTLVIQALSSEDLASGRYALADLRETLVPTASPINPLEEPPRQTVFSFHRILLGQGREVSSFRGGPQSKTSVWSRLRDTLQSLCHLCRECSAVAMGDLRNPLLLQSVGFCCKMLMKFVSGVNEEAMTEESLELHDFVAEGNDALVRLAHHALRGPNPRIEQTKGYEEVRATLILLRDIVDAIESEVCVCASRSAMTAFRGHTYQKQSRRDASGESLLLEKVNAVLSGMPDYSETRADTLVDAVIIAESLGATEWISLPLAVCVAARQEEVDSKLLNRSIPAMSPLARRWLLRLLVITGGGLGNCSSLATPERGAASPSSSPIPARARKSPPERRSRRRDSSDGGSGINDETLCDLRIHRAAASLDSRLSRTQIPGRMRERLPSFWRDTQDTETPKPNLRSFPSCHSKVSGPIALKQDAESSDTGVETPLSAPSPQRERRMAESETKPAPARYSEDVQAVLRDLQLDISVLHTPAEGSSSESTPCKDPVTKENVVVRTSDARARSPPKEKPIKSAQRKETPKAERAEGRKSLPPSTPKTGSRRRNSTDLGKESLKADSPLKHDLSANPARRTTESSEFATPTASPCKANRRSTASFTSCGGDSFSTLSPPTSCRKLSQQRGMPSPPSRETILERQQRAKARHDAQISKKKEFLTRYAEHEKVLRNKATRDLETASTTTDGIVVLAPRSTTTTSSSPKGDDPATLTSTTGGTMKTHFNGNRDLLVADELEYAIEANAVI